MTMIRKLVLGLAAAATISSAALVPTAASAHGFGFGGGWGHHWGFHRFGHGFGGPVVDSCLVVTPSGRLVNVCY
jgi:Spy/CpxP family protein refolding chaperone